MEWFSNETFQERLDKLQKIKTKLIKERQEKEGIEKQRIAEEAARYLKEGLPYAEKIFEWAKEFKNSDIGKQIFSLIYPNANGVKTIWLGRLAINWQVNIRDGDGLVGYKGLDYRCNQINDYCASDPTTLALWVSPEILKAICLCIENDLPLLYDRIERQIFVQLNRYQPQTKS